MAMYPIELGVVRRMLGVNTRYLIEVESCEGVCLRVKSLLVVW